MTETLYETLKGRRMTLGFAFLSMLEKADRIIEEKNYELVVAEQKKADEFHFQVLKEKGEVIRLSIDLTPKGMGMSVFCLNKLVDEESEGISMLLMDKFLDLVHSEPQ